MKRERTRRFKAITAVAVVVGVTLIVVTIVVANGGENPARREAAAAQKCWNATYRMIDANELVIKKEEPVKVARFKEAALDLHDTANVGKNGDYGKFAQGLTGAEFCRQLRQLFLETEQAVRDLPPYQEPSPSPSPSVSPSLAGAKQ